MQGLAAMATDVVELQPKDFALAPTHEGEPAPTAESASSEAAAAKVLEPEPPASSTAPDDNPLSEGNVRKAVVDAMAKQKANPPKKSLQEIASDAPAPRTVDLTPSMTESLNEQLVAQRAAEAELAKINAASSALLKHFAKELGLSGTPGRFGVTPDNKKFVEIIEPKG